MQKIDGKPVRAHPVSDLSGTGADKDVGGRAMHGKVVECYPSIFRARGALVQFNNSPI